VLDLSLHGEDEQNNEVEKENWPEHWHIEDRGERHAKGSDNSATT
jgi:hypothetical protein